MAEQLSQEDYALLQQKMIEHRAAIITTRSMARQFFTHVSARNVRDLTGQSVLGQKFLVLGFLVISIILILGALLLIGRDFGYGAVVAVPLTGIFWTIIAGLMTEQGNTTSTILVTVAVLAASSQMPAGFAVPTALFTLSVFNYRLAHFLAQHFIHRLLTSSFDAYDMLSAQIDVIHHEN